MKYAEVEYIEKGTFQGSEEEVSAAGIKRWQECVVLSKETFERIQQILGKIEDL